MALLYLAVTLTLDGPMSGPTIILCMFFAAGVSTVALWLSLAPFRAKYADDPEGTRSPTLKKDSDLVKGLWWDLVFYFVLWMLFGFVTAYFLTHRLKLLSEHQGALLQAFFLLTIPLIVVTASGGAAHRPLKAAWVQPLSKVRSVVLRFGFGVFGLMIIHGSLNWFDGTAMARWRATAGPLFDIGYVTVVAAVVVFAASIIWRALQRAMEADEKRRMEERKTRREATQTKKQKMAKDAARKSTVDSPPRPSSDQLPDEEAMEQTTRQLLDLPDSVFFLMLARDIARALQSNDQSAANSTAMAPAARELIESHLRELEIAAGLRRDTATGRDIDYFKLRIDQDDVTGMQLLTQWYRFRTAHLKFQVSNTEAEKRTCKEAMRKANDIIFILNSQLFGWDYVPLALQTAADLECLVMVEQLGDMDAVVSLRASPFVALFSDKKLADRLVCPVDLGIVNAPIDSAQESEDAWVEECFSLPFTEQTDDRQYFDMPDFKSVHVAILNGPPDDAIEKAAALCDKYADFDVAYLWLAGAQARGGDADRAIATLMTGLERARLKTPICASLGTTWLEDKQQLKPAIMWWIRSCILQLTKGAVRDEYAFLNLSAIANSFPSLDTERDWLQAQSDQINPARIRYNEQGMALRHRIAVDQGDESVIAAIQRLYRDYH